MFTYIYMYIFYWGGGVIKEAGLFLGFMSIHFRPLP